MTFMITFLIMAIMIMIFHRLTLFQAIQVIQVQVIQVQVIQVQVIQVQVIPVKVILVMIQAVEFTQILHHHHQAVMQVEIQKL